MYNTQDHWVCGFCPSSGFLNTRQHNVSEAGSVSEKLCFKVFGILDDGRSPETLRTISELLN
jgi:hypothetical protein